MSLIGRLSIAAKRMAAQNVLVKDLQGVETLGMVYTFSQRNGLTNNLIIGSVSPLGAKGYIS